MSEYTIHGGDEGKRRLDILSRTLGPSTAHFLKQAGVEACRNGLDLGCGAGAVTLEIARQMGSQGQMLGLDTDERKIQLAIETAKQSGNTNVQFGVFNAYELQEESHYDLVYARFLLSHLQNPKDVLRRMWHALQSNGLLLIEDTDFSGHFSYPASDDFNRYVSLYRQLLHKRGADADIGQKLAGLLLECGFTDIEFQISQPIHMEGEGKQMAELTFDGISKALMDEELITLDEVQRVHTGLVDFRKRNDSLISLPRIFQVRGRKA